MQSVMQSAVFHCPYDGCPYHKDSIPAKSFKKQLFADQHVANKHQEKQFHCSVCDKSYTFEWQLKHHKEVCGMIWSCLSCDKTYSERLSLVVHCKRHQHVLPHEARGWSDRKKRKQPAPTAIVLVPILIGVPVPAAPQDRVILPKAPLIPAATQTHDGSEIGRELLVRRRKSESQAATQTEKKKQSKSAQCPPIRRRASSNKKRGQQFTESTETQTMESILSAGGISSTSCLTGFSSTRTASTNVGTVRRIASAAPNPPSLTLNPFPASEVPLDNILFAETSVQTDEQRPGVMHCSTIETQTCGSESVSFAGQFDSGDLFFELDVNDIETQTIWNSDETTQTDAVMDDLMLGFELLSDAE